LSAHSRLNRLVTLIADAGGPTPAGVQMVTVPAGLGRKARNAAVVDVLKKLSPDIVEYHQQLKAASELARQLPDAIHVL
ncbi:hypothetical protein NL491_28350, partial [Klebsiella pneumoniae]|nr:hypothetical protein [Klebsiella pneumoniae]